MLLWKVRTPQDVGRVASTQLADRIRHAHSIHGKRTTVILAAAPSQKETLRCLLEIDDLPWPDITIGHMDEYIWGSQKPGPQSFVNWLQQHLINRLREKCGLEKWIPIDGTADPKAECQRIGVNGHCGFEDPGELAPATCGPPVLLFQSPRVLYLRSHFSLYRHLALRAICS